MPLKKLILSCCFAFISHQIATCEENVLNRFEKKKFISSFDYILPYRQLDPAMVEEGKRYPLVIFFHGAGERGDDNQAQLVHGMKDFASDKIMSAYPAFVIAPQCPKGEQWVNVPWGGDKHSLPEKPSKSMASTIELVRNISKDLPVDADRIYVTGLSMGGFGTWDIVARHPEMFAAALPICGGGDASDEVAKRIKHLPIWAVHGDKDNAVKTQRSRDMVSALENAGGKPKYTELKGIGHNSWTQTYRDPEIYKWMFSQKRKDD